MSDPEIRFLTDQTGARVAYAVHGTGPVLMCPAWWVSHVEQDWSLDVFRAFFEQLGQHFRVVRYDRPGTGLSDRKVPARTLPDEVDLLGRVLDAVGVDSCSLLAISCAGPVALSFAANHPQRVDKICFYGSYVVGRDIGTDDVKDAIRALVKAHWGLGSRALSDIFVPDGGADIQAMFVAQQQASADAARAHDLLSLTYEMDASDAAKSVTADCMLLHRRGDRAIPFECGRQLAAALPSARLVTLEGRAHLPWIDGDDVVKQVVSFLTDRPTTDGRSRTNAAFAFDPANRQLIVSGEEIPLTPLEFGVFEVLVSAGDRVVTRDELLQGVWKQPFEGSNKVDVVIRSLRKKLGSHRDAIETVTGHGYRLRE